MLSTKSHKGDRKDREMGTDGDKRPQVGSLSQEVIFSKDFKETEPASHTENWGEGRWWGKPMQGPWGLLHLQNSRSQVGCGQMDEAEKRVVKTADSRQLAGAHGAL